MVDPDPNNPNTSGPDKSTWREPAIPGGDWMQPRQGRILDPTIAMSVTDAVPHSTIYVGPQIMVSGLFDAAALSRLMDDMASELGWTITWPERGTSALSVEESEALAADPAAYMAARCPVDRPSDEPISQPGQRLGVVVGTIGVAEGNDRAVQAPDAWLLLQHCRTRYGVKTMRGVGLNHLIFARPGAWTPNPGAWTPNPGAWTPNPGAWTPNPGAAYSIPGHGGRQPVAYVGPRPPRRGDAEIARAGGRRPVVATLDTGCGAHEWFEAATGDFGPVINKALHPHKDRPIGYVDPLTDPEAYPDQYGALDGGIDNYSGHGTFIAGLILQACPDATILPWRAVNSEGPVVEADLIEFLDRVLELVENHQHHPSTSALGDSPEKVKRRLASGEKLGHPIDVLSLSLGYYHENPTEGDLVDATVIEIIRRLGAAGTLVVCSAGNDATARPMFPAAFGPWKGAEPGPAPQYPGSLPVVSVGALNPNRETDAMFTNAGAWVRAHMPGAAVVSTMPTVFQGGLEPIARIVVRTDGRPFREGDPDEERRVRESIDPDDFRGGFAVWSGTSFSAPLLGGKLAARIGAHLMSGTADQSAEKARARAWEALQAETDLTPPA